MTLVAQTPGYVIADFANLTASELQNLWRLHLHGTVPVHLPKSFLARVLVYRLQEQVHGGLSKKATAYLKAIETELRQCKKPETPFPSQQKLKPGCQLIREHQGVAHVVTVVEGGFEWKGVMFTSLSSVAKVITGTNWNGHRFFGLRAKTRVAA